MAGQLLLLPASIVAGESIAETITGYTVTGCTLTYQFAAKNPANNFSANCTASGTTAWLLAVTPAQTLTLGSGSCRFAAFHTVTATGVTTVIDSGAVYVEPSPLATSSYSTALAAVDAAIAAYGTSANRSVTVGEISITYRNLDELLNLRYYYKSLVDSEIGRTSSGPFTIGTRFV